MRNKIIGLLVFSLVFVPSLVFGQSSNATAELQAKIQALLAQIKLLQEELTKLQNTGGEFCYTWNKNLRVGDRGEAVDALVKALMKEGIIINSSTGSSNVRGEDFDENLASYVSEFQEKYASEILTPNGLRRGTGFLGASTRAKLNSLYYCKTVPPVGRPSITVLSPNGGESWPIGSVQTIRWNYSNLAGDVAIHLHEPGGSLCLLAKVPVAQGFYQFKFDESYKCPQEVPIFPNIKTGQYKISVYADNGNTAIDFVAKDSSDSYFTLTSGTSTNNPPKIIGFPAVPANIQPGQSVNFSWSAMDADNDNLSWSIDFGDGGVGSGMPYCTQNGAGWSQSAGHSWANAGTYTIIATVTDCKGAQDKNKLTVTVGSPSSNLPPVIDGVTGPTTLKAGETGTWTIKAHDPENGSLSYGINWGDNTSVAGGGGGSASAVTSSAIQTSSFTHSYSTAGVYKVGFTVTDAKGLVAQSFMSVEVGSTVTPSITVISPNGGEQLLANTNYKIQWLAQNFPTNTRVRIDLRGWSYPLPTKTIDLADANSNSYLWTVSPNLPSGQYRIEIYQLDANGNVADGLAKSISSDSFTITASSITNAQILENLVALVRKNQTSPLTTATDSKLDFDLNADGLVNVTDIALLQGLATISDAQFVSVKEKIYNAVGKRVGVSALYDSLIDFDGNGNVSNADLWKVRDALNSVVRQAPTTESITLTPGHDHYFQVKSGTLTFGDVSSGGITPSTSWVMHTDQLFVFKTGDAKPAWNDSASATYYFKNDSKWYKFGGGTAEISATTSVPAYFVIRHFANASSATLKIPSNVTFHGSVPLNQQPKPWDFSPGTYGKLSGSVASLPNSSVVSGTAGAIVARFNLDTTDSIEDMKFTTLMSKLTFASGNSTNLTNCQLYDGSTAVTTGTHTINPAYTSGANYNFVFDTPIVVAKGVVKTLDLRCNISSGATVGSSWSWGFPVYGILDVTGVTSGAHITPGVTVFDGYPVTVGAPNSPAPGGGGGGEGGGTTSEAEKLQNIANALAGIQAIIDQIKAAR